MRSISMSKYALSILILQKITLLSSQVMTLDKQPDSLFENGVCENFDDESCSKKASDGDCHQDAYFMLKNCKKACGICDLDDIVEKSRGIGVAQSLKGEEIAFSFHVVISSLDYMKEQEKVIGITKLKWCKNKLSLCSFWAGLGHCESNNDFMLRNCAPACQKCSSFLQLYEEQLDTLLEKVNLVHRNLPEEVLIRRVQNYGVPQKVDGGEKPLILNLMQISSDYMKRLETSLESTEVDACRNQHELCSFWASIGKCSSNAYMQLNCAPSCQTCHKVSKVVESKLIEQTQYHGVLQEVVGVEREKTLEIVKTSLDYLHGLSTWHPKFALQRCVNDHKLCSFWSNIGLCSTSEDFMKSHCALSCQACEATIKESETKLLVQSQQFGIEQKILADKRVKTLELVHSSLEYILNLEKVIPPQNFQSCRNRKDMCSFWAANGLCRTNTSTMVLDCSPSCHSCHLLDYHNVVYNTGKELILVEKNSITGEQNTLTYDTVQQQDTIVMKEATSKKNADSKEINENILPRDMMYPDSCTCSSFEDCKVNSSYCGDRYQDHQFLDKNALSDASASSTEQHNVKLSMSGLVQKLS